MSFEIQCRRVGYLTVVDCKGRLVAGIDAESLHQQVRHCIDLHLGVLINLGGVTFVDSSGLGLLVRLATTCRNSPAGLRFCGASEHIQKILDLTKLRGILNIHDTEERAIAAFANKEVGISSEAKGSTVLCIDRSIDLLAFLRGSLNKAGFQTHSCSNLPDALLLLRTIRPGVVIAGPEFASSMGGPAAELNIPIIALDSEFSSQDAGDAIKSLLNQITGYKANATA